MERLQIIRSYPRQRLGVAFRRQGVGVIPEDGLLEAFLGEVAGVLPAPLDLHQQPVSLPVEVLLPELGAGNDLAQHLQRRFQLVLLRQAAQGGRSRVVTAVGAELRAQALELEADFVRGHSRGPLAQQPVGQQGETAPAFGVADGAGVKHHLQVDYRQLVGLDEINVDSSRGLPVLDNGGRGGIQARQHEHHQQFTAHGRLPARERVRSCPPAAARARPRWPPRPPGTCGRRPAPAPR